jgi:hypothetical protein
MHECADFYSTEGWNPRVEFRGLSRDPSSDLEGVRRLAQHILWCEETRQGGPEHICKKRYGWAERYSEANKIISWVTEDRGEMDGFKMRSACPDLWKNYRQDHDFSSNLTRQLVKDGYSDPEKDEKVVKFLSELHEEGVKKALEGEQSDLSCRLQKKLYGEKDDIYRLLDKIANDPLKADTELKADIERARDMISKDTDRSAATKLDEILERLYVEQRYKDPDVEEKMIQAVEEKLKVAYWKLEKSVRRETRRRAGREDGDRDLVDADGLEEYLVAVHECLDLVHIKSGADRLFPSTRSSVVYRDRITSDKKIGGALAATLRVIREDQMSGGSHDTRINVIKSLRSAFEKIGVDNFERELLDLVERFDAFFNEYEMEIWISIGIFCNVVFFILLWFTSCKEEKPEDEDFSGDEEV